MPNSTETVSVSVQGYGHKMAWSANERSWDSHPVGFIPDFLTLLCLRLYMIRKPYSTKMRREKKITGLSKRHHYAFLKDIITHF